jgi:hypothetical protein
VTTPFNPLLSCLRSSAVRLVYHVSDKGTYPSGPDCGYGTGRGDRRRGGHVGR